MKVLLKILGIVLATSLVVCLFFLGRERLLGQWNAPPPTIEKKPLAFPPNTEQTFNSIEYSFTARINSLGLRERELKEEPQAFRIAVLGDASVYGQGVEEEQTWVRQLERILREKGCNVETVNMGKSDSGPPFYGDLAEKGLQVIRPGLVLVGMTQGTDLAALESGEPISEKKRNEDFLVRLTPEEKTRFEQMDPRIREGLLQGLFNIRLVELALKNPRVYIQPVRLEESATKACIGNAAAQLRRIASAAGEAGVRGGVVVLSVPNGPYVNDRAFLNLGRIGFQTDPALMTAQNADEGIRRACEQSKVPFHTVSDGFRAHDTDDGLFFELEGGLTAKGHALFAELVAPIVENIIKPVATPATADHSSAPVQ